MSDLISKINETLKVIRSKTKDEFPIGIILGTGLGGLVKDIKVEHEFDYSDLPHFPLSTVESHHGKLIFGTINGKEVVAMQVSLLRRVYDATDYISCESNEISRC